MPPARPLQAQRCVFVVFLDGELVDSPEHLGVGYLAAVVRRAGHEVWVVDVEPSAEAGAVARIAHLRPNLVGLSLTAINLPRIREFGAELRAALGADCHLTAGGPVATFASATLLREPGWAFLDSIVRGEGELATLALVDKLADGGGITTGGLIERLATTGQTDNLAQPPCLDDLPWPARDQLAAHRGAGHSARIASSRGCTARCTFCNAPNAGNNIGHGKVWRGRDITDVVDEMAHVQETLGVASFEFVDSTFEDPPGGRWPGKQRIAELATEILRRGLRLTFRFCAQARNWSDADSDLLTLMHAAGAERVLLGIEAVSDPLLQRLRKRSTQDDNRRALTLFKAHGYNVTLGFMLLQPYARWSDVLDGKAFLLATAGHLFRPFATRLELYPGATIVQDLARDGLLSPGFAESLDPYAYRFQDPCVERLAENMSLMVREAEPSAFSHLRDVPMFAHDRLDTDLRDRLSRLARDAPGAAEPARRQLNSISADLAAFNAEFLEAMFERSAADGEAPASWRQTLLSRYREACTQIEGIREGLGTRTLEHC